MSQILILNKLIKYLEHEKNEYLFKLGAQIQTDHLIKQKQEFLEKNKKLREKLLEGHCFGFSLIHAVMDYMNKLEWWEQSLIHIANWDEQPNSLNTVLKYSHAANNENKPAKLNDIIERALNYIVSSHSVDLDYLPDINQLNVLQIDGHELIRPAHEREPESKIKQSYFEILSEEEKPGGSQVKTIKKRQKIAGNLTRDQLMKDLDDLPEKAIILVHRFKHTIRIARKGSKWLVYDPNYSHQPGKDPSKPDEQQYKPIYKILSKSNCIAEIFKIHETSTIAIEIASFDENAVFHFPEYMNLLKSRPTSLVHAQGLLIMAKEAPNLMIDVLNQVNHLDEGIELLRGITRAMSVKNSDGWTGLHMLVHYTSSAFIGLVKRVDNSPEGKALLLPAIAGAMSEKNSDGWTGLHMMLQCAPDALLELINRADNSPEGLELLRGITLAMSVKTSDGWTGLHMMLQCASDALLELLKRVNNSPEGKALLLLPAIARALPEKNSDGWTGLDMMLQYTPSTLLELLKRADNSPEEKTLLLPAIVRAMSGKHSDGWTGLHMMSRYAPDVLLALINRVDNSPEGVEPLRGITQAMSEKHSDGWTGLHMMSLYAPDALLELIKRVDNSPEEKAHLLPAIAGAMSEKDSDGWTGLHMMSRCAPDALLELIKRMDNLPEGVELLRGITQAMSEKNSNGWTGLHMLLQYTPSALLELINRVDNSLEGKELLLPAIAGAMSEKNSDGWTGLHMMLQCAPDALLELLKQMDNSLEGKALLLPAIARAMSEKNSGGWTGLHMMSQYAPDALLELIKRADNSPEGAELLRGITQAMSVKTSDGRTGLYLTALYSPNALLYLLTGRENLRDKKRLSSVSGIRLLLKLPNGLDRLLQILSNKVLNNKTTWQYLCSTFPDLRKNITDIICKHISQMKNEELVLCEKKINRALCDEDASYRGLCKTTLFYGRYVKTDLYRHIHRSIQNTLEKNLQETVKRLNNSRL